MAWYIYCMVWHGIYVLIDVVDMVLQHERGSEALPLLARSLQLHPVYVPALIDTAIAHFYARDLEGTEAAIKKVT